MFETSEGRVVGEARKAPTCLCDVVGLGGIRSVQIPILGIAVTDGPDRTEGNTHLVAVRLTIGNVFPSAIPCVWILHRPRGVAPLGAQKAGLLNEAQHAWLAAVALDSRFAPAFTGLGHLEGARGNIGQVSETGQAARHPR